MDCTAEVTLCVMFIYSRSGIFQVPTKLLCTELAVWFLQLRWHPPPCAPILDTHHLHWWHHYYHRSVWVNRWDDFTFHQHLLKWLNDSGSLLSNQLILLNGISFNVSFLAGVVHFNVVQGGNAMAEAAIEVIDKSGKTVATVSGFSGTINIDNVRLWWPYTLNLQDPGYMYELKVCSLWKPLARSGFP